jgi:hypothetical protein
MQLAQPTVDGRWRRKPPRYCCPGELFTAFGNRPPITEQDIVAPALNAEDAFRQTCLTPATTAHGGRC